MARPEIEEYQLYFNRLRPIYSQLFNLAHVITGNCEQAEYCLQYALLDCWALGCVSASHHGFREDLRSAVIRASQKSVHSAENPEPDFDWDGLNTSSAENPLARQIAQEPPETRRILALHFGCGLSIRRTANICDIDARRVRMLLHRFTARVRHRLAPSERRRCETMITRTVRTLLAQPNAQTPDFSKVFRTFQADAASMSRPSRLPIRLLHVTLAIILGVLCIAIFWLAAVLMQPTTLEVDSIDTSITTQAPEP